MAACSPVRVPCHASPYCGGGTSGGAAGVGACPDVCAQICLSGRVTRGEFMLEEVCGDFKAAAFVVSLTVNNCTNSVIENFRPHLDVQLLDPNATDRQPPPPHRRHRGACSDDDDDDDDAGGGTSDSDLESSHNDYEHDHGDDCDCPCDGATRRGECGHRRRSTAPRQIVHLRPKHVRSLIASIGCANHKNDSSHARQHSVDCRPWDGHRSTALLSKGVNLPPGCANFNLYIFMRNKVERPCPPADRDYTTLVLLAPVFTVTGQIRCCGAGGSGECLKIHKSTHLDCECLPLELNQ